MKHRRTITAFARDFSGATILEFALVAPVFLMVLLAIVQFGLVTFNRSMIEAIVTQSSRTAALGLELAPGCDRVCSFKQAVLNRSSHLANLDNLSITANTVAAGGTTQPDICLTEVPSTPARCDPPLNYEEHNGAAGYQGPSPTSLGEAGDLVELRVNYPYKLIIPLIGQYIGDHGVILISSSTVIKNEPF
jgi:Flp pilus assembly pilin Flp